MDPGAALATLLVVLEPEGCGAPGPGRPADAIVWASLGATAQHHVRSGTAHPEAVAALQAVAADPRLLEPAAAIALADRPTGRDVWETSCAVARLLIDAGADPDRVAARTSSILAERRRLEEGLKARRRLR
jgi:hypothetical protein